MAATLVDFLLARLAEDEAVARAALDSGLTGGDWLPIPETGEWTVDAGDISCAWPYSDPDPEDTAVAYVTRRGHVWDATGDHIVRHDPARVLADVEAKRRIVEKCSEILAVDGWEYSDAPDLAEDALYALAQPYADHPDFREKWRIT